jgi:hypothetical protein
LKTEKKRLKREINKNRKKLLQQTSERPSKRKENKFGI